MRSDYVGAEDRKLLQLFDSELEREVWACKEDRCIGQNLKEALVEKIFRKKGCYLVEKMTKSDEFLPN